MVPYMVHYLKNDFTQVQRGHYAIPVVGVVSIEDITVPVVHHCTTRYHWYHGMYTCTMVYSRYGHRFLETIPRTRYTVLEYVPWYHGDVRTMVRTYVRTTRVRTNITLSQKQFFLKYKHSGATGTQVGVVSSTYVRSTYVPGTQVRTRVRTMVPYTCTIMVP